jgi:hypothetical protein
VHVAEPAAAAARDHDALATGDEIGDEVVRGQVADDRARRDCEVEIVTSLAVLLGAGATAARIGAEVMLEAVVAEHRLAGVHAQVDAAAAAPVTAVGTAARYMRLAPEGRGAISAVTGANGDRYLVEKCHLT